MGVVWELHGKLTIFGGPMSLGVPENPIGERWWLKPTISFLSIYGSWMDPIQFPQAGPRYNRKVDPGKSPWNPYLDVPDRK